MAALSHERRQTSDTLFIHVMLVSCSGDGGQHRSTATLQALLTGYSTIKSNLLTPLLHNRPSKLLPLTPANPHLMERPQTAQHTASDPRAKLPLHTASRQNSDFGVRVDGLEVCL